MSWKVKGIGQVQEPARCAEQREGQHDGLGSLPGDPSQHRGPPARPAVLASSDATSGPQLLLARQSRGRAACPLPVFFRRIVSSSGSSERAFFWKKQLPSLPERWLCVGASAGTPSSAWTRLQWGAGPAAGLCLRASTSRFPLTSMQTPKAGTATPLHRWADSAQMPGSLSKAKGQVVSWPG